MNAAAHLAALADNSDNKDFLVAYEHVAVQAVRSAVGHWHASIVLAEEAARIDAAGLSIDAKGAKAYLTLRRVGSCFRLRRSDRKAIFVLVAYRAALAAL